MAYVTMKWLQKCHGKSVLSFNSILYDCFEAFSYEVCQGVMVELFPYGGAYRTQIVYYISYLFIP